MENTPYTVAQAVEGMQANWPQAVTDGLAVTMALHRAARLLEERATTTLAGFNLSRTEFEVLAILRSHPAPHRLTPTELYDAALMSSGGMTKVLKALEVKKLVIRPASDSDGRSRPIELTTDGLALAEQAMSELQTAHRATFTRFETQKSTEELAGSLYLLIAEMEKDSLPAKE